MSYDFPETRDILTAFLTLVSGTLVVSIAFSDKIVRTHDAPPPVRTLMLIAWAGLLLAIVSGGLAVFMIMRAAGCAVYVGDMAECLPTAWISWIAATIGGCLYVSAMLSMVLAAAVSLFSRRDGAGG